MRRSKKPKFYLKIDFGGQEDYMARDVLRYAVEFVVIKGKRKCKICDRIILSSSLVLRNELGKSFHTCLTCVGKALEKKKEYVEEQIKLCKKVEKILRIKDIKNAYVAEGL